MWLERKKEGMGILRVQDEVRTDLSGSGQDDGNVKDLANGSVGHQVVSVESGIPIPSEVVEADLHVEDHEHLCKVAYIRSCANESAGFSLTVSFLSRRSHGTAMLKLVTVSLLKSLENIVVAYQKQTQRSKPPGQ